MCKLFKKPYPLFTFKPLNSSIKLKHVKSSSILYFLLFTPFSLSSSEEKDAKTESKDEKGEEFFFFLLFKRLSYAGSRMFFFFFLQQQPVAEICGSVVCRPPPERLL